MFNEALKKVVDSIDLSAQEMEQIMDIVMQGEPLMCRSRQCWWHCA